MKKAGNFLFFLLVLLIGITSCDPARVFDEYKEIDQSTWHKDSLVVFHIPVSDTLQNHNLLIQLRNETNYRYSNLWLFIEIIHPNGEIKKDTFELAVADQAGRWLGDGFGRLKTIQVVFRRDVYFPVSGEYTISIQHGMREEELKGIHDMGFRIEKSTP